MNKMKKQNYGDRGITLIALVVTIIVLLILAGVAISLALGENGILKKAQSAHSTQTEAQIQEELQLAINGLAVDYHTGNKAGRFKDYIFSEDNGKGQDTLKAELGAGNLSFNKGNSIITYKGLEFEVADDGTIAKVGGKASSGSTESNTGGNTGTGGETISGAIDWDEIKRTATKPAEQTSTNDIGIDANGNVINLDLWDYIVNGNTISLDGNSDSDCDNLYLSYLPLWDSWRQNRPYIVQSVDWKNVVCPQYIKIDGQSQFFSVTRIGNRALEDTEAYSASMEIRDNVNSIVLPTTLCSIGDSACYQQSLITSITLPDGLTSIGGYAFSGCSSLSSITLPDGLTSIGESTFSGCSSLSSITLPDGLTSIGEYAFSDCLSLSSITLHDGLTSIGENAFSGSKLENVFLKSSTFINSFYHSEYNSIMNGLFEPGALQCIYVDTNSSSYDATIEWASAAYYDDTPYAFVRKGVENGFAKYEWEAIEIEGSL